MEYNESCSKNIIPNIQMSVMIIELDKFRESFNFVYVSQTGLHRIFVLDFMPHLWRKQP